MNNGQLVKAGQDNCPSPIFEAEDVMSGSSFCIVFSMAYMEITPWYLIVITLLFNRYCDTLIPR